ncbi:MAG TPA: xanthine dehydrogenase family protein molybdopterin-binding subunit [Longimicrobiales bacterium]|nr:xanthine dehydrogenase family protein molybdopterin-binding subunit [Longimicrobiales bacterium]
MSTLTRRNFVKITALAGGGLLVGVYGCGDGGSDLPAGTFEPNALLRVDPDGTVTVISKHLEMGQGAYTGLATLVAEEMDADWSRVRVVAAPADPERYANLLFGIQGTGGSSAMANSWEQYRRAGATALAALVAAAASEWGVDAGEVSTEAGEVVHAGSGRRLGYGALAGTAATLPVPEDVALKDPSAFRLIGQEGMTPRVDAGDKAMGRATFTQDVKLPGMLTAVVAHPPRFGATVAGFDDSAARAVPGVVDVVQVPTGVAVVAEHFWAAQKGREALTVRWDESQAVSVSDADIFREMRQLAGRAGREVRNDGDAAGALSGAARSVELTFEVPYLAHACMEPLNCVVELTDGGAVVRTGAQIQTLDQAAVAGVLGLEAAQVQIETLYAGGSFGRRAAKTSDYIVEAAQVAQAMEPDAPLKLVWTREDDTRAGFFRPAFLHRVRAGVDADGRLVAWWHRAIGSSTAGGSALGAPEGDPSGVEGIEDMTYAVSNLYVDQHTPEPGVPVQWWRSVGHSHTAFAVEVMVDELARAAGQDPVAFRRRLLADDPRKLAVLELAADRAGWGSSLPAGRARGVAVHRSFGTYVAEVAEVSLENGRPRVHRVVCAVDCGQPINPDVIRMQMESGIVYGLSAALFGRISIDRGRVVEGNFDGFRIARMSEAPEIEVHIVPSTESPTGVGEPGLPPIAPAVANAVAVLRGGRPVTSLPMA